MDSPFSESLADLLPSILIHTLVTKRGPLRYVCRSWAAVLDRFEMWLDVPHGMRTQILRHVCFHGQTEAARWLFSTFGFSAADACLKGRCAEGGPIRSLPGSHCTALSAACARGHFELAQWLATSLKLGPSEARAMDNAALRHTCENGHLAIVRWICAEFKLGSEDIRAGDNYALRHTCENGHLAIVQWICAEFKLGPEDIRAGDNYALSAACRNGHLVIAQWLTAQFKLDVDDVCDAGNNLALVNACENGQFEVARWLVAEFELNTLPVGTDNCFEAYAQAQCAFVFACNSGHLAIARWLVAEFKLTAKDVRKPYDSLHMARARGHHEVAHWLVTEFGDE